MQKTINQKVKQGDLMQILDAAGARLRAPVSNSRNATSGGPVINVDFSQPSAERFLRLYCAAVKPTRGTKCEA